MKAAYINLILFFMAFEVYPQQKCLDIYELKKTYRVESFSINSSALYDSNHNIELHNVWVDSSHLIVIACLPNFNEDGSLWAEIDENKIIMGVEGFNKKTVLFKNGKKFESSLGSVLLKKENGKLYINKNTFFQSFIIQSLPLGINTPDDVININRSMFPLKAMIGLYPKLFNGSQYDIFPIAVFDNLRDKNDEFLIGHYLSGKKNIKGVDCYSFWTFPKDIAVNDYFRTHNGLGRFLFVPDVGVVGASFDFYFSFNFPQSNYPRYKRYGISMKEWENNILNEEVMIAEGFK